MPHSTQPRTGLLRRSAFPRVALLVTILPFNVVCSDPHARFPMPADGADLSILRQFVIDDSREHRRMRVVVRDAAAWARLPLIDERIDFEREMALIVTLGRVVRRGYSVRITRVRRDGPVLRVEATVESPPPDAPPEICAPFCVAVIPRCDLRVAGFDAAPPPAKLPGS